MVTYNELRDLINKTLNLHHGTHAANWRLMMGADDYFDIFNYIQDQYGNQTQMCQHTSSGHTTYMMHFCISGVPVVEEPGLQQGHVELVCVMATIKPN